MRSVRARADLSGSLFLHHRVLLLGVLETLLQLGRACLLRGGCGVCLLARLLDLLLRGRLLLIELDRQLLQIGEHRGEVGRLHLELLAQVGITLRNNVHCEGASRDGVAFLESVPAAVYTSLPNAFVWLGFIAIPSANVHRTDSTTHALREGSE